MSNFSLGRRPVFSLPPGNLCRVSTRSLHRSIEVTCLFSPGGCGSVGRRTGLDHARPIDDDDDERSARLCFFAGGGFARSSAHRSRRGGIRCLSQTSETKSRQRPTRRRNTTESDRLSIRTESIVSLVEQSRAEQS